jgi:hypothetical protein
MRVARIAVIVSICTACGAAGSSDGSAGNATSNPATDPASSSVCARIRSGGIPPRSPSCPPGTRRVVLGEDGRIAKSENAEGAVHSQTAQQSSVRIRITGLVQEWCEGNGIRHGPYIAHFINRKLVVSGSFQNGKKIGLWSQWSSSGQLLRFVQHNNVGRGFEFHFPVECSHQD